MNCPYCGSQLSIEDEVCPYCGKKNEAANQYTQKKKSYKREWQKAKTKVDETTHFVHDFSVFLIIAIILAVFNIIVLILRINTFDIELYLARKDISRNLETYINQMDMYADHGEYYELNAFYYKKDIYLSKDMKCYETISYLSQYYCTIFDDIRYLIGEEGAKHYMSQDELLEELADRIYNFYEVSYSDIYEYTRESVTEKGQLQVDMIISKTERLLEYYCNLSEEQIKELPTLPKTKIALMIGRSLGIYE